jgi:putative phosphoribosyl transferase
LVVTFASREEAGQLLGRDLAGRGILPDVVLGLPRGGVVVAAEVARVLQRPLSVLVVRKIGHPRHREFAIGALAEHEVVLLDDEAMHQSGVAQSELAGVIAEETGRLRDYEARFHQAGEMALAGKSVLIVDDGLATGATAVAAVMSAKKQKAREVIIAVPVASPEALERLSRIADAAFALTLDPDFMAVGRYYDCFPQTADEEVLALLHHHA